MSQISAPVRIVALVGLLAAVGIGGWTFTLGRGGSPSASSAPKGTEAVAKDPVAAANSVAGKLNAHNRATDTDKPVAAHTAKRSARLPRSAAPAPRAGGAPTTIAAALRAHRVAVVVLYNPAVKVDAVSVGEAQVGAARAHAGFLRVNVLRQRRSLPFAKAYDVRETPMVLLFARPGKLVQQFSGFADAETVAQAALNAARGIVVTPG